jgi:hypothetical protein
MKSFLFGSVFGIAIGTVGFSGIAPMLDQAVDAIQNTTRNWAKENRGLSSAVPPAPYLPEQSQSNLDELIRQELAKQQSQLIE